MGHPVHHRFTLLHAATRRMTLSRRVLWLRPGWCRGAIGSIASIAPIGVPVAASLVLHLALMTSTPLHPRPVLAAAPPVRQAVRVVTMRQPDSTRLLRAEPRRAARAFAERSHQSGKRAEPAGKPVAAAPAPLAVLPVPPAATPPEPWVAEWADGIGPMPPEKAADATVAAVEPESVGDAMAAAPAAITAGNVPLAALAAFAPGPAPGAMTPAAMDLPAPAMSPAWGGRRAWGGGGPDLAQLAMAAARQQALAQQHRFDAAALQARQAGCPIKPGSSDRDAGCGQPQAVVALP
ncbi:MAG: hypothetical protein AB9M60_02830 [Leptothrix sp. (in: b-proteobacteria)]